MSNVTITDIARQAKLSVATVSNAINGTRSVSRDSREKIYQAIRDLGGEEGYYSENMRRKTTMTIGVVVTSLQRIFFSDVLAGIRMVAGQQGYNVQISVSDDSFEKEMMIVKNFVDSKVDGIILHTVSEKDDEKYLKYLRHLEIFNKWIPVVSIERNFADKNISSVFTDNYQGGKLATEHLFTIGAEDVACIKGPANSEVSNERVRAFCDVAKAHGIKNEQNRIHEGDFSPLSGYRVMRRILLDGIKPQGIFACNDQMAIGAINAIQEFGLRVPEDIKVVGYDNTFVASLVTPQLSTVNVPKQRMGQEAFGLLHKLMTYKNEPDIRLLNDELTAKKIMLPTDLIIRQTTVGNVSTSTWDLEDW